MKLDLLMEFSEGYGCSRHTLRSSFTWEVSPKTKFLFKELSPTINDKVTIVVAIVLYFRKYSCLINFIYFKTPP